MMSAGQGCGSTVQDERWWRLQAMSSSREWRTHVEAAGNVFEP